MAKNLILYYSRAGENYVNGSVQNIEKGNTEIVAEIMADVIDADLFKVETIRTYDASYMKCIEEAHQELSQNARPELKRYLESIDAYDNIVVAGPCWWGTYPMAIFTQLDRLDFTGKNVYPVMTHEGSGLAGAAQALKEHCVGANIKEGLAIHGAQASKSLPAIEQWAQQIR